MQYYNRCTPILRRKVFDDYKSLKGWEISNMVTYGNCALCSRTTKKESERKIRELAELGIFSKRENDILVCDNDTQYRSNKYFIKVTCIDDVYYLNLEKTEVVKEKIYYSLNEVKALAATGIQTILKNKTLGMLDCKVCNEEVLIR